MQKFTLFNYEATFVKTLVLYNCGQLTADFTVQSFAAL